MGDDNVDKLIELVKGHPAIYDRNSVRYKNAAYKATVWQNIALTLGQSEGEVLTRWKSLRDRFCREHRKMMDPNIVSPRFEWAYYQSLMFLKNHTMHRSRLSNVNNQDKAPNKSPSPLRMMQVDVMSVKDNDLYELEEETAEYNLNEYNNISDHSSGSSRQSSPTSLPSPSSFEPTTSKKRKINAEDHNYNYSPSTSNNVENEIGTGILKTLNTFEKCLSIKTTKDSTPNTSKEQFFEEVRVFINGFNDTVQNKVQNRIMKYLCKCKLEILNDGNIDKIQI